MKYSLDTNICIALLKDSDASLLEKIKNQRAEDFVLSSVVKAELYYGARYSSQVDANLRSLSRFFAQFQSIAFDDRAAEVYGNVRALLRREGNMIGANDLLIASSALAWNLILVTRNRSEFIRVPGLAVETW